MKCDNCESEIHRNRVWGVQTSFSGVLRVSLQHASLMFPLICNLWMESLCVGLPPFFFPAREWAYWRDEHVVQSNPKPISKNSGTQVINGSKRRFTSVSTSQALSPAVRRPRLHLKQRATENTLGNSASETVMGVPPCEFFRGYPAHLNGSGKVSSCWWIRALRYSELLTWRSSLYILIFFIILIKWQLMNPCKIKRVV